MDRRPFLYVHVHPRLRAKTARCCCGNVRSSTGPTWIRGGLTYRRQFQFAVVERQRGLHLVRADFDVVHRDGFAGIELLAFFTGQPQPVENRFHAVCPGFAVVECRPLAVERFFALFEVGFDKVL